MLLHIIEKKLVNKKGEIVDYNLVFDGSIYITPDGYENYYRDFEAFEGIVVFLREKNEILRTFIPKEKFSELEFLELKEEEEKEKLLSFE